MKTNYTEIFQKIRPFLDIKIDQGYPDDDFIRGLSTIRVITRHGRLKYLSFCKISDDIICDSAFLDTMIKKTTKPIWRINQKRVAHGFESWFPTE